MRLITQNLIKFVESREYTDRTFENKVGWSNGFYGKVRGGKIAFSTDKLRSIIECFPELNIHWLCTGKGEMYLSVSEQKEMGYSKDSVFHDLEKEYLMLNDKDKENLKRTLKGIVLMARKINNTK